MRTPTLFALLAGLSSSPLLACDEAPTDAPAFDLPARTPVEGQPHPTPVDTHPNPTTTWAPENPPYLVSRYAPMRGLTGTRITILTAFDSSGCWWRGECSVTIGELEAPIVEDTFNLEVIVPQMVETAPLCVTWKGRTECGEPFEVLDAPLIYQMYPAEIPAGADDTPVTLIGEGFPEEGRVYVGWQELEVEVHGPGSIVATLPSEFLVDPATLSLTVYAPNVRRCGAHSEPMELVVAP